MSAAPAAKSLQSCPTLCDPIDGSPPGFPVPGIPQARTLEWVAISFSNAWKWKVQVNSLSRVRLFAMPWTAAYQAPLSLGFSRQEYWSGVPLSTLFQKDARKHMLSLQSMSEPLPTSATTLDGINPANFHQSGDKINFHILRYGEVILAYIWLNLNFILSKTACWWPIKRTLYICFNY